MARLRVRQADTLYPDGYGQDYGRFWPIDHNDPAQDTPMRSGRQSQEDLSSNQNYLQDDKRVTYHVESDEHDNVPRSKVYDIDPNEGVEVPKTNRVRIRINPQQVLEDQRSRAYRIHVTPPIRDETDPGNPSYALPLGNDPRQDEVNYFTAGAEDTTQRLQAEHAADISTPAGRFERRYVTEEPTLKLGSKVTHREEGLQGRVSWANDKRVTVTWSDQTRERFSMAEARELLAYVDDAEDQVAPINQPSGETSNDDGTLTKHETTAQREVDAVLDAALAALDEEDEGSLVELVDPALPTNSEGAQTSTDRVDLAKAKLQRQVHEYEQRDISAAKEQAATEVVELMRLKGLIPSDQVAAEQHKAIIAMDDVSFGHYKNAMLALPNKISAPVDDIDPEARALIANHRGSGGGGATRVAGSDASGGYTINDLVNANIPNNPFANLEGPSKPIQMASEPMTRSGYMSNELSQLDWTVLTKTK